MSFFRRKEKSAAAPDATRDAPEDCVECETAAALPLQPVQGVVLTAQRVWDGQSDVCMEDPGGEPMCVASDCGKIVWVGLWSQLPEAHAALPVHHFGDAAIMPGLIDAHIHLEFDPAHPLHSQPSLSSDELTRRMQVRAASMVAHGITTARDLGGKGGALALRALIQQRACIGPRLLCAGQPLTKVRGHCHQWGGEVSGEAAIRDVVARQLKSRVDVVKVMATGGVRTPGTNPAEAVFSQRELEVVVQAAGGAPVAAHAHGVQGIQAAAQAGVSTIEHCSWVNRHGQWGCFEPAAVELIASRGIFVCPTVHAGWARNDGLRSAMAPALRACHRAGVRLVASSDAGAIPNLLHHQLADALPVLAGCAKMSNADALRCATSVAAQACGVEHVTGSVCEGMDADLLVVPGSPLVTLDAIRQPLAVLCRGAIVQPCQGSQDDSWSWSARGVRCECQTRSFS